MLMTPPHQCAPRDPRSDGRWRTSSTLLCRSTSRVINSGSLLLSRSGPAVPRRATSAPTGIPLQGRLRSLRPGTTPWARISGYPIHGNSVPVALCTQLASPDVDIFPRVFLRGLRGLLWSPSLVRAVRRRWELRIPCCIMRHAIPPRAHDVSDGMYPPAVLVRMCVCGVCTSCNYARRICARVYTA
ncbi:hypothetical protein PYCCODRAFT_757193 [Trametes coccinea BRFM310]|uniref:Uncharacterized protein n=1 Tax=Trametes coccinea (strain BRFM310) TaxID=1353009 RepID=A0A1Y2J1N8_TRAC3|nr:hypothetical protein PYCCODRAFT_757193 [Trametes coccinea BRFM310]